MLITCEDIYQLCTFLKLFIFLEYNINKSIIFWHYHLNLQKINIFERTTLARFSTNKKLNIIRC